MFSRFPATATIQGLLRSTCGSCLRFRCRPTWTRTVSPAVRLLRFSIRGRVSFITAADRSSVQSRMPPCALYSPAHFTLRSAELRFRRFDAFWQKAVVDCLSIVATRRRFPQIFHQHVLTPPESLSTLSASRYRIKMFYVLHQHRQHKCATRMCKYAVTSESLILFHVTPLELETFFFDLPSTAWGTLLFVPVKPVI